MCGLLRRHMYGTRRAAEGWQDEYSSTLGELGFIQGVASACVFSHPQRQIMVSVHGDDFTCCGLEEDLLWIQGLMQEWLDAEVPLLSKTGCLAQSLRGACVILARKKCKKLPGLVAAKTELHIAIVLSGGSCKLCNS